MRRVIKGGIASIKRGSKNANNGGGSFQKGDFPAKGARGTEFRESRMPGWKRTHQQGKGEDGGGPPKGGVVLQTNRESGKKKLWLIKGNDKKE